MTDRVADLAYAAGIIDGEGCIFIARTWHKRDKRLTHVLCVKVSMIDKEVVEWLAFTFGGPKHSLTKENRRSKGHHDIWTWRAVGQHAEDFLRQITPFLIAKTKQAEIALEFRKLISAPGVKLPEGNLAKREHLCYELRASKHTNKTRVMT